MIIIIVIFIIATIIVINTMSLCILYFYNIYCMYQKLREFEINWHSGASIAIVFHLGRISLFYD